MNSISLPVQVAYLNIKKVVVKMKLAILNCTANTTSVQIIAKAHEKGHQFKRRNDKIIKTSTRVSIFLISIFHFNDYSERN